MYIPYDKIGNSVALFLPIWWRQTVRNFFGNLKISQNCDYINKNVKNIQKELRAEAKKRPIRVAFLCDEPSKWKCQTLYDLMLKDEHFHPFVLASRYRPSVFAATPMSAAHVKRTYDFFKNKGMETYYAYNCDDDTFIPAEKFDTDLIFYQEPWYVETSQGPVVASKWFLTYYVPYFVANVASPMEYGLRFHQYIHKHYIMSRLLKNYYSPKMKNKGKNLVVAGHPQLDHFYLRNKNKDRTKEDRKYIIYAPHWSINIPNENYATFQWNGRHILDFAKKHPELNWIFKPHPALKERAAAQRIMTKTELDEYWNEWAKIGTVYETGDYLDLFDQSYAMITDCGSFLTEYFLTEQPVIHLISPKCFGYNPSAQAVVKNFYKAHNIEELDKLLETVLLKREDPMKETRIQAIKDLGFADVYAAQNILDDIKQELGIE